MKIKEPELNLTGINTNTFRLLLSLVSTTISLGSACGDSYHPIIILAEEHLYLSYLFSFPADIAVCAVPPLHHPSVKAPSRLQRIRTLVAINRAPSPQSLNDRFNTKVSQIKFSIYITLHLA